MLDSTASSRYDQAISLEYNPMLIPGVRTTLKAVLPTILVKTGSSILMTSRRSCSTVSPPLERPTSSQSKNKVSSTRNTTETDSRKLSPRGHVGDHHAGLFISGRTVKLSSAFNLASDLERTVLFSCEIAKFCLYYGDVLHARYVLLWWLNSSFSVLGHHFIIFMSTFTGE